MSANIRSNTLRPSLKSQEPKSWQNNATPKAVRDTVTSSLEVKQFGSHLPDSMMSEYKDIDPCFI
jgi:hypothetical protein